MSDETPSRPRSWAATAGAVVTLGSLAAVLAQGFGAVGFPFPGHEVGFLLRWSPASLIVPLFAVWPLLATVGLWRGDLPMAWLSGAGATLHSLFNSNEGAPRVVAALVVLLAAAGHLASRRAAGEPRPRPALAQRVPLSRHWGFWLACGVAAVALLLASFDLWWRLSDPGFGSPLAWVLVDVAFFAWPALLAIALRARRPAWAWVAWTAYVAQSAQYGLSSGGIHLTFGATLGLLALLVDGLDRRGEARKAAAAAPAA